MAATTTNNNNNKINNRSLVLKIVVAGIMAISAQISVSQLQLVRRAISEDLYQVHVPPPDGAGVIADGTTGTTTTSIQAHGDEFSPPSNTTTTTRSRHKKAFAQVRQQQPSSSSNFYLQEDKNDDRSSSSSSTYTEQQRLLLLSQRKGLFQNDPNFSDKLMDEFVRGAANAAQLRRQEQKIFKAAQRKYREQRNKRRKQQQQQQQQQQQKNHHHDHDDGQQNEEEEEEEEADADGVRVPQPLKVPLPIFVPSLPKSGTTTTHRYFECGGHKSAHLAGRDGDDGGMFKIGQCAQRNVRQGGGAAVFEGCGDYDVWTDTGYVAARYRPDRPELRKKRIRCFYPLIEALDDVYASYPNATFLFVVRETESWLNSIQNYHDGFIMELWKRCHTKGFPGLDGTLEDFQEFYEWHKEMIQNFALEHSSLTYIEVDLESPETAQILEEKVGINAGCWGHYNQLSKSDRKSNTESSNNDEREEESEEANNEREEEEREEDDGDVDTEATP